MDILKDKLYPTLLTLDYGKLLSFSASIEVTMKI